MVLEQLMQAEYGAHYLVIYSDITALRELYAIYAKTQLEDNDEIVMLIPYLETNDMVRRTLTENAANIDIQKYERKEEEEKSSLIILDSAKAYFGIGDIDKMDLEKYIQSLVKRAERQGKKGVSIITDVGAFYLFEEIEKFIKYELSLPIKYDIKLKRFCVCSQSYFDKLSKEQKRKVLSHHGKYLIVTSNASI